MKESINEMIKQTQLFQEEIKGKGDNKTETADTPVHSLGTSSQCYTLDKDHCVKTNGCALCTNKQACKPGDRQGPFDGSCSVFEAGSDCHKYTQCTGCIADKRCFYCKTNNLCKFQGLEECTDKVDSISKCYIDETTGHDKMKIMWFTEKKKREDALAELEEKKNKRFRQ